MTGEVARARYGVVVVLAGLVVLLAAFVLTALIFDTAADVSTALGAITGVIGTIVGAYFGVQVGSSGKAEAEAARSQADNQVKALAAVGSSEQTVPVLGLPTESIRGPSTRREGEQS